MSVRTDDIEKYLKEHIKKQQRMIIRPLINTKGSNLFGPRNPTFDIFNILPIRRDPHGNPNFD